MSVFLMALLLCSVGRTSLASPRGEAKSKSSTEHRPGVILVKFRPDVPTTDAADSLGARDLAVLGEVADLQVHRVAVPEGQEKDVVELLTQDPRVEYAEVDYAVHATIIPNDTRYYLQWGPAKIQAPEAWDVTVGSSAVIIAVVDTGVDLNHPDLNAKIVAGWDYVNNDGVPQDDHGHGTHVAGIAAAETNNLQGIAGISWTARIMPVKVLDEHGDGYYSDVADGVRYACNNGARIINLSLGGSSPSSTLEDALEAAYEDGCLMVAAAGNGWGNGVDYPGRYPETMAVAATNQSDVRAGFSDYGPEVDVAAPGVDIFSTLWNNTYGWKDGTSMAAPHVAGQAALIWSLCPGLTNAEVQDLIESTADDRGPAGWDQYYGFGRINVLNSVEAAGSASTLTVNAHQMIFLADATTGPWPQTLLVGNDGTCGSLSWDVTDDAGWLDTDPYSGEASASESGQTTVAVDKSGLTAGNTYAATITVTSTTLGVLGSPQTVDVTFVYSSAPLTKQLFPLVMRH